jgi:hypothetical protein
MKDGKCSKKFPRGFKNETSSDGDGYPEYRRRSPKDGGREAKIVRGGKEFIVDNSSIVAYNPLLSKTFNGHVNVEVCNSIKAVKYVIKYVNKGSDMAVYGIQKSPKKDSKNRNKNDEVENFKLGRYISASEAVWRLFNYNIHEHYPAVEPLSVHLPDMQIIFFDPEKPIEDPGKDTTLTAFFNLCQNDEFAKSLLYVELPQHYLWKKRKTDNKMAWLKRQRDVALGRVYTVPPSEQELHCLRLLLFTVRGPTSFESLRTFEGNVCSTFKEAARLHGLLENDSQYNDALCEASFTDSGHKLRDLFVTIISVCEVTDPKKLWDNHKDSLSEDLHDYHSDKPFDSESNYNEALIIIEDMLLSVSGKDLSEFGLPKPTKRPYLPRVPQVYSKETSYDTKQLKVFVDENLKKLTTEQKIIFDTVMSHINHRAAENQEKPPYIPPFSVLKNQGKAAVLPVLPTTVPPAQGGILFMDAPGGTGKTFTSEIMLAKLRSDDKIALAVASTGIASSLLPGGTTAHRTFKIPLDLDKDDKPVCNVEKGSALAKLLQDTSFIVWDECTMVHKKAFEAVDRMLRDIRGNDFIMGGVLLLLTGDFRQTLPVVQGGTRADEINATLKSSVLWPHVKKLHLTKNMRAHLTGDVDAWDFSETLEDLGNGVIGKETNGVFKVPESVCVKNLNELMNSIYPNIEENYKDSDWLSERAILAPRNVEVNALNQSLLEKIPGNKKTYKSFDKVMIDTDASKYPIEFLNSLDPPGVPQHTLDLKVGCVVMLLRNLNPPKLCNGTRIQITSLHDHLIRGKILSGQHKGQDATIPRIPIIPTGYPFQFKRIQFPVKLSFVMTINKSRGQSIKHCGLYLENPCFSHGQFYVGASRVGAQKNLKIFAPENKTVNIVYQEVLGDL